ncbi:MAG TPA: 1,2-phenylacetyl-CoA epoxidase subunit PaaC [Gemmatimonadaceae bacterium]|nr:1,2-phenylacetyl-CoA epoxidase subunit PaaC [Gemmatimonadaceae bacterium]
MCAACSRARRTENGQLTAFFQYLLRLADDRLVLGHRTSEWCGHGPILEEDIALANIALDLIGQANLLYQRAAAVDTAGRDADALAFLRDAREYRNALIVELPRGDFGFTIVRQFLFSTFALHQWEALAASKDVDLAGIAAKAAKESRYHVRHSAEWVARLGDGTDESHARAQDALDDLWRYTGELFLTDDLEQGLVRDGLAVDSAALAGAWRHDVEDVIARATLRLPGETYMQRGGRTGLHTEHLGHMLAEMQVLPRSFPGAKW